ncbi:hypothetical protein ANN_11210 [Periplaneta americana]|uniref:Uncharacterized protein n=1 Tax=Periplaneta americana TaxID=6978 RepID=A0ABQ8T4D1_PERAM|nr:hypothetical protein ANN_11210 [Periplaneta americana]
MAIEDYDDENIDLQAFKDRHIFSSPASGKTVLDILSVSGTDLWELKVAVNSYTILNKRVFQIQVGFPYGRPDFRNIDGCSIATIHKNIHYKIFIREKYLEEYTGKFQENISLAGIIDARVRYRAAARRLRNTGLRIGMYGFVPAEHLYRRIYG